MLNNNIKNKLVLLRSEGKTYSEIQKALGIRIPKSTLTYWCKDVVLPEGHQERIKQINLENIQKAGVIAAEINRKKREEYLHSVFEKNLYLSTKLKDLDVAKIALAILYLGEGSRKESRGGIMFGNSDPLIIKLFLSLLRKCYSLDESKFRCTVQCRADQNTRILEYYWSKITSIPLKQFYGSRIDPRTIGRPSKKPDYKGVCRIDYLSRQVFLELLTITKIISTGP